MTPCEEMSVRIVPGCFPRISEPVREKLSPSAKCESSGDLHGTELTGDKVGLHWANILNTYNPLLQSYLCSKNRDTYVIAALNSNFG